MCAPHSSNYACAFCIATIPYSPINSIVHICLGNRRKFKKTHTPLAWTI